MSKIKSTDARALTNAPNGETRSLPAMIPPRMAVMAGAATLGAGALATAAVLFSGPLGRMAQAATEEAGGILAKYVSAGRLLAIVGLERKRSRVWTVLPPVASMVTGLALGSAAMWCARRGAERTPGETDTDRTASRTVDRNAQSFAFDEAK